MSAVNSFRGIQGIREIKTRMTALVSWYQKFKPDLREIVIDRKDYDLIARWPRAASIEKFDVTDNGIFLDGMRLTYATGQGRYEKQAGPEQTVIV